MRVLRHPDQIRADEDRVFAMLVQAAEEGKPCPSNLDIASVIGAASVSSGPKTLGALVRRGLIEVTSGHHARVVTILATGKRTAGKINKPHWRVAGPNPLRVRERARDRERYKSPHGGPPRIANSAHDPALPQDFVPVDRTPCFKCGVRGDIGCKHQRLAA